MDDDNLALSYRRAADLPESAPLTDRRGSRSRRVATADQRNRHVRAGAPMRRARDWIAVGVVTVVACLAPSAIASAQISGPLTWGALLPVDPEIVPSGFTNDSLTGISC